MDLTTLIVGAVLLIAAIGIDTIWHPRSIMLDAKVAPKVAGLQITDDLAADVWRDQVEQIITTSTVIGSSQVRSPQQPGIGISVADTLGLSVIANAVQAQLSQAPDRLRLHVYSEGDKTRILISGYGTRGIGAFEQEFQLTQKDEIVPLIRRAAVNGMARIDPYTTALSLMWHHVEDRDFSASREVIDFAKSRLPNDPISPPRSLLENLEGMIWPLGGDLARARSQFGVALKSFPDNHIATLNLALVELSLGQTQTAKERLDAIIDTDRPTRPLILSVAYALQAITLYALAQPLPARTGIAEATRADPHNPMLADLPGYPVTALPQAPYHQRNLQDLMAPIQQSRSYAELGALFFQIDPKGGKLSLRAINPNLGLGLDDPNSKAPLVPTIKP